MQIIIGIILVALYVGGVVLFFVYVAKYILALVAFALSVAVVVNYLRAVGANLLWGEGPADRLHWREDQKDQESAPEPAFRQYFFDKAYQDYRAIVHDSLSSNSAAALLAIHSGKALLTGEHALFTWPLGLVLFVTVAPAAIAAAVVYAVTGAAHLLLVIVLSSVTVVLAAVLSLLEWLGRKIRGITRECPHADCYQPYRLPVYVCPTSECGAHHRNLVPGEYGLLRRRCKCGKDLPTLAFFGRGALQTLCPKCERRVVDPRWPSVHIPLAGGASTGKTGFLMATMVELNRLADVGRIKVEFLDPQYERIFARSRQVFEQGSLGGVTKTAAFSPDAFLVEVSDRQADRALVHLYDPAGEAYQKSDALRLHRYFSHARGVILVLDPFSIPRTRDEYERELGADGKALRPSREDPQAIYDLMIANMRAHRGTGNGRFKVPIAVVLTKADGVDLHARLVRRVREVRRNGARGKRRRLREHKSQVVRDWVREQGLDNLVRGIENDFWKVRYFYCAALKKSENGSKGPFRPRGVLEPVDWILEHYYLQVLAIPGRRETRRLVQ